MPKEGYTSSFTQSHFIKAGEGNGIPLQYSCLETPMDRGAWWAAVHGVAKGRTRLSDFTFTFHFHALEKEMATHSSVLASRIPDTTERLHSHFSLSCLGEGNGKPLQCSCLENLTDGGAWWAAGRAWWAAVYGVAQSRTRLKRLSSSSSRILLLSLDFHHSFINSSVHALCKNAAGSFTSLHFYVWTWNV